MARRRLHGETQKRRKKKQTQALKLQERIQRPEVTQEPAPFERDGVVESQDIAFLEAMREMGVQPMPRPGHNPERIARASQVIIEANEGDSQLFEQAMEALDVRPLHRQPAQPDRPRAKPASPAGPAPSTYAQPTPERPTASPAAPKPSETTAPFTRFELPDNPNAMAEQLAELLSEEYLDPINKYEGAPPPPSPTKPTQPTRTPDAELDLHGKTQEEALRMVTNFLLTSHGQRLRHVLIITGKGNRSGPGGPVLRGAVETWLERNGKPYARSFRQAPKEHGGSGAIWVDMH